MPEKNNTAIQPVETPSIEKQYLQYFVPRQNYGADETYSLEQPSIYEVVETVTTYGAYEDPV